MHSSTESQPSSRRLALFAVVFIAGHLLLVVAVALYALPLPQRLQVGDSVVVDYANDLPAHVFLAEDDRWRIAVTRDDVDPAYVDALVRFEDKRFFDHVGVDPLAIGRALWLNVSFGRRMSGASTITMQLVRVLEPRPRSYLSKAIEAFRAVQLELHLSKEEILAAYLTYAPYGRNIEGVEAASLAYFGHRASELSPAEIATLLAVPQNPNRRYPTPANVERLTEARDEIAIWLADEGKLPLGDGAGRVAPDVVLRQVRETAVPDQLAPYPREIPHVAYWLKQRHPQRQRLQTTLDPGIQLMVERSLQNHRDRAAEMGIDDTSVVVINQSTREIVALVGGFDFWGERSGAQIASFDVARSPGSLLKPLIFALAIDRGVAHPRHLVEDIPIRVGTYAPSNYDGSFSGLVRLDHALSKSLNVPFVKLLHQIGVDPFIGTLRLIGADNLAADPEHYGLSSAIGGVELTPVEIAGIFAALGGDGSYVAPQLMRDAERHRAAHVVDPSTAWLTRRALRQRDRPGFDLRRVNPGAVSIWWKTGTSYGHRDAWAAGGGPHYAAVVWMGNLNNRGSSALVGADRSGPVLFDVLEGIEFRDGGRDDPRPDTLAAVEVCAYSGHLPTHACDHRTTTWAARDNVPVSRCPYHVTVDVDDESGEALAPACRADREFTPTSFVVWPAAVRRYMADRSRAGPMVPALADGCGEHVADRPPRILSPPHDQTIVLFEGIEHAEQEVPLEAESSFSSAELNWFVNGQFVGTATADDRVWWTPSPGRHELVVMDAAGHASKRTITVR